MPTVKHPRPTCLESLLGAYPAACPRSRSQGGMMSSLPARRRWKGEGDAGALRPGLGQIMPAGHHSGGLAGVPSGGAGDAQA